VDASLSVVAYLQQWAKPGWGLFCLRGGEGNATGASSATFALARQASTLAGDNLF
jgi:hypothetical protein